MKLTNTELLHTQSVEYANELMKEGWALLTYYTIKGQMTTFILIRKTTD